MRIKSFNASLVQTKTKYTVVSSVRESESIPFVTLKIETEEGLFGISYVQSFNYEVSESIINIVKYLEQKLINKDALATEVRWREMWEQTILFGHSGIVTFAISLIDIALWDLKGKFFNEPVYRLLGGEKDTFEVYASDALWLVDEKEVLNQTEKLVEEGYRAIKMRMGRNELIDDLNILRALKKEFNDTIEIMADVNQGWSRKEAQYMCYEMNDLNLYWLEEPIATKDFDGYIDLTKLQNTHICFGENIYGIDEISRCLSSNTSTYFTPDLQRIGGVTGWLKLSPIMETYCMPSTIHLFPEIAIHLMSIYPYAEKIEWMSWSTELFKDPLQSKGGEIKIPQLPGFGMEFISKL